MSYKGSDFYDNDVNLEKYIERRKWQENANDTLEKPVSSNGWAAPSTNTTAPLRIITAHCSKRDLPSKT
ncbi:hypothetical protein D3C73_1540660 [compost metagenome]